MKKLAKALLWSGMLGILLLYTSCEDEFLPGISGEGAPVERELELRYFEGFINTISAKIELTQGDEQKVVVIGQENIIDNIRTDVYGELWTIRYDQLVRHTDELIIKITLPFIDHIGIAGTGSVESTNYFNDLTSLDFMISGSGNIDFEGSSEQLGVLISGSGDINLVGETTNMEVFISGSGIMDSYNCQTQDASLTITGSGSLFLLVDNYLKVTISGSGDVYYKGEPEIVSKITGTGSIINDN